MNKRYIDEKDEFFIDGDKSRGLNALRQETELFNEESYVVKKLIHARRISLPNGGEDWEIFVDKVPSLTLKGIRFSKKEREFFRTSDGLAFLVNGFKAGWKSVSEFKRQVKNARK